MSTETEMRATGEVLGFLWIATLEHDPGVTRNDYLDTFGQKNPCLIRDDRDRELLLEGMEAAVQKALAGESPLTAPHQGRLRAAIDRQAAQQ